MLFALCVALVGACTDETGGAVELAWSIERRSDGASMDCATRDDADTPEKPIYEIGRLRLWWQLEGEDTAQYTAWRCEDRAAVTDFVIPAGAILLWVEPECADGTAACADTYTAPAPRQRDVTRGEVTTLGAILINVELPDSDEPLRCKTQPCICPPEPRACP